MMFPKPMRLEPWVAFDGALAVDVVDALTGQTDAADADAESGSSSESAAATAASAFAAPMMAAPAPTPAHANGTNIIAGHFLADDDAANDGYSYTLTLPNGVTIPNGGAQPFLPFYDNAELALEGGLEKDARSLYFTVSDTANGTFNFYDFSDINGKYLPGFENGDYLFAKSPTGNTLSLFRYDGGVATFQRVYGGGWGDMLAVHQDAPGGGVRFALSILSDFEGVFPDAEMRTELMFKSLVFTPKPEVSGGDGVGSFNVDIYYEKSEPGENLNLDSDDWNDISDEDNFVGGIADGKVVVPPVPGDDTGGNPPGGDDSDGDDSNENAEGGDGEQGGTTPPVDTNPPVTPEPTPDPTPTPTPQPEPTPEPDPTPVDVVPEVVAPVTPPPSADSGGSAGDAPSAEAPAAEAGGDAPGSESGAESADSADAMGADDLVYIQQREVDSADDAAAAAAAQQQRREDAAVEAVPVTVEAMTVEAAMMFEFARDIENLLGTVRSDRAGLEEILVRLRDEYLARPGDDWGEGRNVLRRLFDFGNTEMTAINRVIAELTRQMDDFDSLSAARRDGMVMESLRELALSVERRSGETGAITRALAEVVDALAAARAGGREIDSAAVAALYERVYAREIEVWQAKAALADPMGRELAAAVREFARK